MADERIPFRDGLTCRCVVESLPLVEADMRQRGLIEDRIQIFQLGYRTDVEASAGTHARGGCTDVDGTPTAAEIDVWRQWGWTMQDRSPFFAADHAHGWPYRCTHLSEAAQRQEADWDRKDAGLQGTGQVQGRWPILPWYDALEKMAPTLVGVPLMADAAPIKIDFDGDQLLTKDVEQHVWINAERHVTLVGRASPGVDIRATIAVSGLKPGEHVRLWFRKTWKKTGEPDVVKSNEDPVYITHTEGVGAPSTHFTFAGALGRADEGWTPVIRIAVKTNSATAVVTRRQIRGWRLDT